ncbi:hypothetical protein ACOME3_004693 [Neoechinorhynchus agilis]
MNRILDPTGSGGLIDVTNNEEIKQWLTKQGYGDLIKSPTANEDYLLGNYPSITTHGFTNDMSKIRDSSGFVFSNERWKMSRGNSSSSSSSSSAPSNIELAERHLKRKHERHRNTQSSELVSHLYPQSHNETDSDDIVYKQRVFVRYLQPPTPEPEEQILLKDHKPRENLEPIIIRQQPSESPATPPPIIYREHPPPMPKSRQSQVIEYRSAPPPPRPIIIERLPPPPPKQPNIIIERWLPPKSRKARKIIIERDCPPNPCDDQSYTIIDTRPVKQPAVKYVQQLCADPCSNRVCIPPQSILNCCPPQLYSCFSPCAPQSPATMNVFYSNPGGSGGGGAPRSFSNYQASPEMMRSMWNQLSSAPNAPSQSNFLNTQSLQQIGQQYVPPIRQSVQNVWDAMSGGGSTAAPGNLMNDSRMAGFGREFIPNQHQSLADMWSMLTGTGSTPLGGGALPPAPSINTGNLGAQFIPPPAQSLQNVWSTMTGSGDSQPQSAFPAMMTTNPISGLQTKLLQNSTGSMMGNGNFGPSPFASLLSSYVREQYTPKVAAASY